MTGPRLLSPRWLAAGGAVILAAVLGVAMLLQNTGAACAAPPSTSAKSGKATFYDLGSGMGNCSYPSAPANDLFVALGPAEYSGAAACGTYLDVTGPKGKVRVKVIDSCPECPAGHIDLSRTAFKKIGAEIDGIIPITYKMVPTATAPGPISVRVKEGSSQYWLAVLIDNHVTQLKSVTVNGKTTSRKDYNYWEADSGAGSGPFKIKITDVYGNSTTVSGIKLSPGATQKTTARLSGSSSSGSAVSSRTSSSAPVSSRRSSPKPSSAAPVLEATSTAPSVAALITGQPTEPAADQATGQTTEEAVDLAGAAASCG